VLFVTVADGGDGSGVVFFLFVCLFFNFEMFTFVMLRIEKEVKALVI